MKLSDINFKFSRSHFFTGVNQLFRAFFGILMIVLVPLFLGKAEQGYWFSFMSLSALMIIADSGFSTIILQFAAHEFAFLRFSVDGSLEGDADHLRRLGSFFLFSLRWALGVALVAFPVILGIGLYIMSSRPTEADWLLPWLLYAVGSMLAFINNGLLYFFEGCDAVSRTQRIRAIGNAAMIVVLCASLAGGLKLYALGLSALASALLGLALMSREFGRAAQCMVAAAKGYTHAWRREFLPLLGRYSLSWASGYFIFQMYTPIMFHYYGPVEAGKIGISITLWNGVLSLSNIWLSVVTPKINIHISKKEWRSLDHIFFRNLFLSAGTYALGMGVAFGGLALSKGHISLAERFLPPMSMMFLACGWGLQLVVNGLAIYLRAHKEEPMVAPSVAGAIYVIITTYLSARFLSADYFFLGFFTSYLWGLPWVYLIFRRKRNKDHLDEQPFATAYNSDPNL